MCTCVNEKIVARDRARRECSKAQVILIKSQKNLRTDLQSSDSLSDERRPVLFSRFMFCLSKCDYEQ